MRLKLFPKGAEARQNYHLIAPAGFLTFDKKIKEWSKPINILTPVNLPVFLRGRVAALPLFTRIFRNLISRVFPWFGLWLIGELFV